MSNNFELFKNAVLQDKKKSILILLSLIIGIIYIVWRFFFVMTWAINIQSIVWGLAIFWADFYGFFNLMTFCFETLNKQDLFEYFKIETTIDNFNPSVDIFICTYNEDVSVVKKTALAATFINYENKKIYILDDGNRPEMKKMADTINVNYITREQNVGYKAGNLNNALSKTSGDLFVVFDADHVPTNTFFDKLLPYFQDETVALIQTPQHFYNPDPFQKNLELTSIITNEQDLFFRIIQNGRSYWNATICCGTNWIARRSSIEKIGGIPTETITEDMLTSIKLQEQNFKTLYYNEPLAAGLSAENINEYILQRNRWGRGTAQIFFSKNNPLKSKTLNIPQKICYLGSINYYFVGLARLIYLLAPSIFILFNLQGCVATIEQLLLFQLPYLVLLFGSYFYISKSVRKPLFTETYESVISYDLAVMIINSIFRPKKQTKFRVTEKNLLFSKAYFDYISLFPLLIIMLILVESLLLLPVCYFFELRNSEGLLINGFWLFYNVIIILMVMRVGFEKPQLRKYTRIPVQKSFELVVNGDSHVIQTVNLCEGGALAYIKSSNVTFEKGQNAIFICHEKTGNVEIATKIVDSILQKDKYYLRLEFVNVSEEQEAVLIKNIYSFTWRWNK